MASRNHTRKKLYLNHIRRNNSRTNGTFHFSFSSAARPGRTENPLRISSSTLRLPFSPARPSIRSAEDSRPRRNGDCAATKNRRIPFPSPRSIFPSICPFIYIFISPLLRRLRRAAPGPSVRYLFINLSARFPPFVLMAAPLPDGPNLIMPAAFRGPPGKCINAPADARNAARRWPPA